MPFNLEAFKASQTTAAMDTSFTPPPEGTYKGAIEDFSVNSSQGTKEDNKDQTYYFMEVKWALEDPQGKLKELTGQDKVRAIQKMSLDIGADGKLAAGKGKNITLGFLRDVLGQNVSGKPWAPQQLIGGKATLQVAIDKFTRKDGGDGQKAIVKSVAPYNASNGAAASGSASSGMPARPAGR